jgi:signal recognition particle subunit SRP54
MKLIPGMNKIDDGMLKQGEQQLKRIEAMISSMTEAERRDPDLLAAAPSRRRRIAAGSGHSAADVDKVLADFQKMRGFMQQMTRGGMPGMPGMGMPGMPGMGMPGMGGMPGMAMPGMAAPAGGRGRGGGGAPKPARPKKPRKGFGDL